MDMLATTIALAAPFALYGEGLGRGALPVESSFPEVTISRADAPTDWPFSIDQGRLSCIESDGQRFVFFSEILTPEEMGEFGAMKLPRMVAVSANPLAFLATLDNRELYLPWDSLETMIKRLAPYERMGWKLCEDAAASPPSTDL